MTMTEKSTSRGLVQSSGGDGSQRFNAAKFGKDMDAFDDFLTDIASPEPEPESKRRNLRINQAIQVLNADDSDNESLFSSDSEDEFGGESAKPEFYQTDGALEQLFSKPATKSNAATESPKKSPKKKTDELSPKKKTGELSPKKKKTDELSKSDHGGRRRTSSSKDPLSSSSHGPRRGKRDELSSSSHGRRRSSKPKDELSSSTHSGKRRSSRTEENPPVTRRAGKRGDELSRSEHGRPRTRRSDLYSHASKKKSASDLVELSLDTTRKLQERRAHYERTRREKLGDRPSSSGGKDLLSQSAHVPRRHRSSLSESLHGGSDHGFSTSTARRGESMDKSSGMRRSMSSASTSELSRGSEHRRQRHHDLSRDGSSSNHSSSSRASHSRGVNSSSSSRNAARRSLSRQGSNPDLMEGMYASSNHGMRRTQSSADATSLSRKPSRASSRGGSSGMDIDGLVMKLKRDSKMKSNSKSNATWDLKTAKNCGDGDSDIDISDMEG